MNGRDKIYNLRNRVINVNHKRVASKKNNKMDNVEPYKYKLRNRIINVSYKGCKK
jgi:hypothetical protein